jgi:hypothetical protein
MILQKFFLVFEVDTLSDLILQKFDQLGDLFVSNLADSPSLSNALLIFLSLLGLIDGLLWGIIDLVAVSSLPQRRLRYGLVELLLLWAAILGSQNDSVVLNDTLLFLVSWKVDKLTKLLKAEGSVGIMITPPEDGLDVCGSWVESVLFKEHDKVWHRNQDLSSANLIEGLQLLVVLVLEQSHSHIISLANHVFLPLQDSNGHRTHRDGEA